MSEHVGLQSNQAAACSSTDALASLLLVLSHAFSYPSMEQAARRISYQYAQRAVQLMSIAQVDMAAFRKAMPDFIDADDKTLQAQAQALRVEHTRLFYSMPRLINLTGTHWVEKPISLARRQSERVLVQKAYDDLGLCNQSGVNEPADHIVSELDYAAYVTASEAMAWKGNDAASAHEWRLLRDQFVEAHLRPLALGIAEAIFNKSSNPQLKGHALLLEAVIQRCVPGQTLVEDNL